MTYTNITLEPFYIAGIAVRTTNANGQSQRDIGNLWQRFYEEQVASRIPDKISEDVYCVYTEYERDAAGYYTTLLGCRVNAPERVPDGLASRRIPGAIFRVYRSVGKLPDAVLATWTHIWNTPINRSYAADFDVYHAAASDETFVETFVSVK